MNYTTLPLLGVPFSTTMARVAFRLIEIDYRKRPDAYHYPPEGIRQLSIKCRHDGWYELQPWLLSAAKSVAVGYKLTTWRMMVQSHSYAPRRLDKVPIGPDLR